MELKTITEVSKKYDVSTRTLRYYEKLGLIDSCRKPDYAYRVYSDEAISRLQIILMFRKLNIRLKEIQGILSSNDPNQFIAVLNKKLAEVDHEIESMNNVREVINMFLHYITEFQFQEYDIKALDIFNDEILLDKFQSASFSPKTLKEKKTMEEIKNTIEEAKVSNVRIIHLPPMTVASSHCGPCQEPERIAKEQLGEFIKDTDLCKRKPDIRIMGFNNPNPDETGSHGYEFWVTIPEDMVIEQPMDKKSFEGGLYAAHSIKMGDFHEWQMFFKWVEESDEYDFDRRAPLGMDGLIEEELNAFTNCSENDMNCSQLDLLIPIKKKQ